MKPKQHSFEPDDGANALRGVPSAPSASRESVHPTFHDDLKRFVAILPPRIQACLAPHPLDDLVEVVLDLGRTPEARFAGGRMEELSPEAVTEEEIRALSEKIGFFTDENRGGIAKTLHRISAIRNRHGDIVGFTCRVGKIITGTIEPIRDIVGSGKSILMLGRPGVGKTTKLREMARLLADEHDKRVVIIDTSNEIAGDGDIPHPAVGRARRMQVPTTRTQQEIMIEAVQNHTPQVIIVDEIGNEEEALAARTIAERGVTLIATAHGSHLENIVKNPLLSDLVGGIQTVTLGDEEAKRRSTQKTVLEREKKPTFDICIEIRDRNTLAIYPDVAEAVDHLLRGWTLFPEVRKVDADTGKLKVLHSDMRVLPGKLTSDTLSPKDDSLKPPTAADRAPRGSEGDVFRVFLYSVTRSLVDRILDRLQLGRQVEVTDTLHDAHAVVALRGQVRPGSKLMRLVEDYELPIHYAKTNTMPQIQRTLREAMEAVSKETGPFAGRWPSTEPLLNVHGLAPAENQESTLAMQEAREAVETALSEGKPVELTPRRSYVRRLQHELVERHNLTSISVGDEPNRRLKILPPKNPPAS